MACRGCRGAWCLKERFFFLARETPFRFVDMDVDMDNDDDDDDDGKDERDVPRRVLVLVREDALVRCGCRCRRCCRCRLVWS